jgi:hypothetical protein
MATFEPAISILRFGGWHKTGHRSNKFATHRRSAIPHYDPEMQNGGGLLPPPVWPKPVRLLADGLPTAFGHAGGDLRLIGRDLGLHVVSLN